MNEVNHGSSADASNFAKKVELWFTGSMDKHEAIKRLGGTALEAARAVGITLQAVRKWPNQLPPRIADRVVAALARMAKKEGVK
jgi:hypothetical protein